jgi:hypothetical protein
MLLGSTNDYYDSQNEQQQAPTAVSQEGSSSYLSGERRAGQSTMNRNRTVLEHAPSPHPRSMAPPYQSAVPGFAPSPVPKNAAPFPLGAARNPPAETVTATSNSDESSMDGDLKTRESIKATTASIKPDAPVGDMDDTMSIYTDDRSLDLPRDKRDDLVRVVARKIWTSTAVGLSLQVGSAERIATALPDLLKELSQALWSSATPAIAQDSLTFLRHYRRYD